MTDQPFVTTTALKDVVIISRPSFPDPRGFFREINRASDLETALGFAPTWVQANHSRSSFGTLRGIHAAPWYKLVTVTRGQVQAVISDLRPESATFGQHVSVNLGEDNFASILVPAGCGNSFLVLSDVADYVYQVSDYWAPGKEVGCHWADPELAISWQNSAPLVSEKDAANPTLRELFPDKFT
jgi:dTDP-4-dehydrorhamnose 3,5-epimerase